MRRLTKIKWSAKLTQIRVEYETSSDGGTWDEQVLSSREASKPSFHIAMQCLKEHAMSICELPESYATSLTVTGISFSYGGEQDIMGATITCQKKLRSSTSPLVINTPHKPSAAYSDEADENNVLPTTTVLALEALIIETSAYLDGERLQRELSLPISESATEPVPVGAAG